MLTSGYASQAKIATPLLAVNRNTYLSAWLHLFLVISICEQVK